MASSPIPGTSGLTQAQMDYITRYAPYANLASQQTGLPSRVILAKLALETSYGTRFANNNLPGLKAKPGNTQTGGSDGFGYPVNKNTKTWERENGRTVHIKDGFVAYPSPEQSISEGIPTWLANSGWKELNDLADRPNGGGIFDRNDTADASALKALIGDYNKPHFSTDDQAKLQRELPKILDKIPNLSEFGIAPTSSPDSNFLNTLLGYGAPPGTGGMPNVSEGLGQFANNAYWSRAGWDSDYNIGSKTTQYQPNGGVVLPRENNGKKETGITLPPPPTRLSDDSLGDIANHLFQGIVELTGQIPGADLIQKGVDAVKSGASSVYDLLGNIGRTDEAKAFAEKTGLDPSQYVINDAYRAATGRDMDAPSQGWAGQVLNQQGAQGLFNTLANSQEGAAYQIGNLYQDTFGRQDPVGVNYWLDQVKQGKSLPSVEAAILSSPEAQSLGIQPGDWANLIQPEYANTYYNGTNAGIQGPSDYAGIINDGYNVVLHRAPDATGSDYFSQALQNGSLSQQGLIDALMQSPEYVGTHPAPSNSFSPDPLDVDTYNPLAGPQTSTQGPGPSDWQSVINNAFQAELQRAPDQAALSYFGPQVQAGTMDASTLDRLLRASPEWKSMHSEDAPTQGPGPSQYASVLGPLASEFATLTGRPLDATGGDYFTQQVQNGTPQSILEAQLLTAPEVQAYGAPELANLVNNYQTTYGLSPTEVQTLKPAADQFASVLGRPVDTPTLQYWDSQIDAGKNMPTILAQMLQAPEVQAQSGSQGYQTAVNAFGSQYGINPADYLGGMLMGPGGVTGIGNGTSPNGGASNAGTLTNPASMGGTGGFANTPSLVGDGGVTGLGNQSGANVINGLYQDILGRNADAGAQGWLDKFNQGGLTLGGVANALTQSDEYKQNHPGGDIQWDADYNNPLQDIFARQLGRIGDTNSMGYWLNQMGGGGQDLNAIFKQIGTTPEAEAFIGSRTAANPWQPGITYQNGSVFHDGVNLGAGALFDPASSEKAYLNTQVNQINQGAQQSAAVERQLTQGKGVPMPVFQVNGTDQGNSNAVAGAQNDYLNKVNTALAGMAPVAPSSSSFLVGMPVWR